MIDPARHVPRLHVVTDDAVLDREGWSALAGVVLEAGGSRVVLHVRGPATSGAALFEHATSALAVAARSSSSVVVNDRVDVALAVRADGVHLGARSLTPAQARVLLGDKALIGASAHRAEEIEALAEGTADYAFMGTIFPTPSHEGVPGIGESGLRQATRVAGRLPVCGIGGIALDGVARVLGAGAWGLAVVRGVWDHPSPGTAVVDYLKAIEDVIDER